MIDTVKQAMDRSREASVAGHKTLENLTTIIEQFQRTRFGGYVETMKRVK